MADAVTSQTLHDGKTSLTMKFTNISDGTGESAVLKVDVSALTPAASSVFVKSIQYSTDGMSARLLWDADTDVLAWVIPQNAHGRVDFENGKYLKNNAGTGVTGDLLLTTNGHSSGDTYSILIEMGKVLA